MYVCVCDDKTENGNAEYNSNEYDSDVYYGSDVNSHGGDDGDESDVSLPKVHNFERISNFPYNSNDAFNRFPSTFDEMFGKSPFRNRIFEEFNNYWRNFHHTGNNF